MATFNVQGKVVRKTTGIGVSFAMVKIYHLGQAAPIAQAATGPNGSFNVSFAWTSGSPDVHFKVTQSIDGAETVIYNENPATQTRHNIANVLAVTLKTDDGLTLVVPNVAQPFDSSFVFTRVGVIGVNQIDTVGATASGYAFPDTVSASPNSPDANAPFGATLDIAGWFGLFCDVYRYKIQYSSDGGTNWVDISDPLANSYYQPVSGKPGTWITVSLGPFNEGGQSNVYKLPYVEKPGKPWVHIDRLARWDTTKTPDGLYRLRLVGFRLDTDGTTLVPAMLLVPDPSFGELRLRLDNQPPVAKILSIQHTPPSGSPLPVQVCEVVNFATGKLAFEIQASDANGHLRAYSLAALFGHNLSVTPPPTVPVKAVDNYAAHIDATRHWNGGVFTVEYDGTVYPKTKMPTCAYQFRLQVSKRTTNGYGAISALEDTVHITLTRP